MFLNGHFGLRNQRGGQGEWLCSHAPAELACAPATERNLKKSLNMRRTVRSRSQANRLSSLRPYRLKWACPSQEGD